MKNLTIIIIAIVFFIAASWLGAFLNTKIIQPTEEWSYSEGYYYIEETGFMGTSYGLAYAITIFLIELMFFIYVKDEETIKS